MDKNFMNIDDLVRQRLGGGEEHEQAGSWGRMRDLLDKEMPQKKPAGMYWRRSLSAIALLLLVAGASVGGYEMMKNKNAAPGAVSGELAAATANTNSTIAANNNTNNNSTTNATNTNNDHKTTAANENKTINNLAATTVTSKDIAGEVKPVEASMPVKEQKKHIAPARSKAVVANNNSVASNSTGSKQEKAVAANDHKAPVKHTDAKAVAHEKKAAKENNAPGAIAATADKKATTENTSAPVASNTETISNMPLSSSAPSVANNSNNSKHKTISGSAKIAAQPANKVAAKTTGNNKHKTPAVAVNNTPVAEADEVTGNDNITKTVRKSSRHATANSVAAVTTHNKPAAKVAVAPVAPVLSATMGNTGSNNSAKTAAVKNIRKSQKQIQRLVLSQHMVRVSPTQVKLVMDTISIESATEEADIAMAPPAFGPQSYEKFLATTDETTEAVAVKENRTKKSKGSSSLENLNAAFNDMKTKVKGARFTPGLTAGINGTFFGPNSFKGFQFGITGNVTFSETFAVQGELKYFNRINNNYTLSDNYYTYTPSAAGGYTRTMIVNPYSLSTLHSIELPLSVRYNISTFNFYVGGNFAYSFAVNTGAYPLADPSSATQVATIGNDNAPKIQNDDFNSRFGFGYLVGASCQVSPNVVIDLRNVQTIWDNSSTIGSKYVSGQLYRSPSLQLSIGYRLGGNRNNKE